MVYKVDVSNGASSALIYELIGDELGAYDLAIGSNGKGLLSTRSSGSPGEGALREIVLEDDTLIPRPGYNGSNEWLIHRGADHTLFSITLPHSTGGFILTYDAVTDSFPATGFTGVSNSNGLSAVNRDGSRLAFEIGLDIHIRARPLGVLKVLPNLIGGLIFDPIRDLLYAADATTDEIVVFDTHTWNEIYRMGIGEDVDQSLRFNHGVMSISHDGTYLFMSTPSGIRMFDIQYSQDCDSNAIHDLCDIYCAANDPITGAPCIKGDSCGTQDDCNSNGIPDGCEQDCNDNGLQDDCDIAEGSIHPPLLTSPRLRTR